MIVLDFIRATCGHLVRIKPYEHDAHGRRIEPQCEECHEQKVRQETREMTKAKPKGFEEY